MRVVSFRIVNYKSFLSTPDVPLSPHFNVVVGQNNVGKTALVEALSGQISENPHRSVKTKTKLGLPEPGSRIEIAFAVDHDEVIDTLAHMRYVSVPFPAPDYAAQQDLLELLFHESVTKPDTIVVRTSLPHNQLLIATVGSFESTTSEMSGAVFQYDAATRTAKYVPGNSGGTGLNFFPAQLADMLIKKIYAFKAERYNIGRATVGSISTLQSDASNLPQVLNLLQTKSPARFRRYRQDVMTVFPQIKDITIPPAENTSGGPVEVFLWEIDPESEREDLATSLAQSGTGVGQVMAMLYVAINTDFSTTIIIDEPQSFLHPGAIQKLLSILRNKYSQHQYIVTTHSSMAITAGNPETILLVRKRELESYIEPIDMAEREHLELLLSEIGTRLSDVFGADGILWVEGPTEEQCFPLIVQGILKRPLLGITVIGVIATGEFERKQVARTVQIYSKLSRGKELIPPAVGFVFDREDRTEEQRSELRRLGHNRVHFLPRKMYENYLLNPEAIAAVIAGLKEFESFPPTTDNIQAWLNTHQWDYFGKSITQTQKDEPGFWHREVDGVKVLNDIFRQFLGEGYTYEKIEYGVAITKWLIEHSPDDLGEIATLLTNLLPPE